MLLVASRIRRLVGFCHNHGIACHATGYSGAQMSLDYLGHVGFFQSLGLDFGKEPGQAPGNTRYIPVTEITKSAVVNDPAARLDTHVGESVERYSHKLATILAQNNKNLHATLSYCIREIIRNVFEHSGTDSVWIVGQCWPNNNKVEVAILDEGIGIKRSLAQNPNLNITSDADALTWAIRPGISGKAHQVNLYRLRRSTNDWDNSGYGLFVTHKLSQLVGEFVITSGSNALLVTPAGMQLYTAGFHGTAIKILLTISKLPQLDQAISQIVNEGERIAQESATAIGRASRASASVHIGDEEPPF